MSIDASLVYISEAEQRLALVETPAEAIKEADWAESARIYAKRSGESVKVINHAVRIKLSAERKAGELLTELKIGSGKRISESNSALPLLSDLGISKMQSSRWQKAATVSDKDFTTYIHKCTSDGKEATSAGLYKLAAKTESRAVHREPSPLSGICTDLADLKGKKFGCIYADPPWKYGNQSTRGSTDSHYNSMTVDEICALPVGDLAMDESHLHLWVTNAFLFEAPKIFDAWGFEFKSSYVWVKPQMGMGNYWRNSHEIMLLGIRGGLTAKSRAEMSWIEHRRGKHSAKPDKVRETVMKLSPGPYLELFGRRKIDDWTVFGNQIASELL